MQVKCASCDRSVYLGDPPPGGAVEVSCEGCLTELIVTAAGEVRLAKKPAGFSPGMTAAAPLHGIPGAPRPPGLGPAAPLPSAVPLAPLPAVPRPAFTPPAPVAGPAPLPTLSGHAHPTAGATGAPLPLGVAPHGAAPLPGAFGPITVPRPIGAAPVPGHGGTGPIAPLGGSRGTGPIHALPTTPGSIVPRPAGVFVPPQPPASPPSPFGAPLPGSSFGAATAAVASTSTWTPAGTGVGGSPFGHKPPSGPRAVSYDDTTAVTHAPAIPDPEATAITRLDSLGDAGAGDGMSIHEQQTVIGAPALDFRPEDVDQESAAEPTLVATVPGFNLASAGLAPAGGPAAGMHGHAPAGVGPHAGGGFAGHAPGPFGGPAAGGHGATAAGNGAAAATSFGQPPGGFGQSAGGFGQAAGGFGQSPGPFSEPPAEAFEELTELSEATQVGIDAAAFMDAPAGPGAEPSAGWDGAAAVGVAPGQDVGPLEGVAAAAGMPFADDAPPLGAPPSAFGGGPVEVDFGDADDVALDAEGEVDVDEATSIVRNPLDDDIEPPAESTAVVLHPIKERSRKRWWLVAALLLLVGGGGAAAAWVRVGGSLQHAAAGVQPNGGEAQLDQIVKELEGKSEDELAGTATERGAAAAEAAEAEPEGAEPEAPAVEPAAEGGEPEPAVAADGDEDEGAAADEPTGKKKGAKKKPPKKKKVKVRKEPKKKAKGGTKKKESIDSLFE